MSVQFPLFFCVIALPLSGTFKGHKISMGFFGGFAGSPRDFFWVLTFGSIQSSPSLEIPSTLLGPMLPDFECIFWIV